MFENWKQPKMSWELETTIEHHGLENNNAVNSGETHN